MLIIFCIIVLIFFSVLYLCKNKETFENHQASSGNPVTNFLMYPGQRLYCPHMISAKATRFFNVPGNDSLAMKFCCTSCLTSVSNSLANNGEFSIGNFTLDDLGSLRNFHRNNQLNFPFPENTLSGFVNKPVLRKNNLVVQILKQN